MTKPNSFTRRASTITKHSLYSILRLNTCTIRYEHEYRASIWHYHLLYARRKQVVVMECVSDSHLEPPHCSISIRLSLNFCANSIFNNEFVLMNGNVNMWNLYVWAASSSEKKTRAESSSWCNTYALNNNTVIYVLHSLIKCSSACTIERTADFSQYECSMRRFSKSLALFTRHHPHCLSLVNSPILF